MELLRSSKVAFLLPLLFFFLHILLMISSCDGRAVRCHAEEREALLQFKDGLSGASMISSWGVRDGEDCCSWNGIGCDNRTGHVVELNLRGGFYGIPSLRGKINPSLAVLKYLRFLDLSENDFEGSSIPPFLGSFQRLMYLDLSYTNFSGIVPQQLGNLSSLQVLDLSYIYDVKSNYQWLSQLHKLQCLDLSYMNLTMANNLFEVLNELPYLETLRLYYAHINYTLLTIPHVNFTRLSELVIAGDRFNNSCWLFNITSLEYLDLYFNYLQLDGCQNDFTAKLCNLKSLSIWSSVKPIKRDLNQLFMECSRRLNIVSLELAFNSFHGQLPGWLGEYKNLQILDLDFNNLSGSIPESIGAMTSLKKFSFMWNNLMGFIPQSIGSLQSLEYLDLSYNNLSGPLPSSLWDIISLQYLDLSRNSLRGNLSKEHFVHLNNLTSLDLSSNLLQVTLSPHWVPPFNLTKLGLGSCKLGPHFPLWIRTQNKLKDLNMSDSYISDVIPQWLWNFSSDFSYVDLSMNNLRGVVPAAMNSSFHMTDIDLHSNMLQGSLSSFPPAVRSLVLSNNLFSGPINLVDMPSVMELSLSGNSLTGNVPPSICKDVHLLILDLSDNHLSGQLPSCLGRWNSVYRACYLTSLHLNNNNLRGTLPASLSNCKEMYLLDIGENNFSGKFPNWISNSMLQLAILRLRSNSFYDSIPMELSNLTKLQVLDLAVNNFWGSIPPSIGNLNAMKTPVLEDDILPFSFIAYYKEGVMVTSKGLDTVYGRQLRLYTSIDLSGNKLSGEIPGEVGRLVYLRNLNLSHNYLSDRIPETFSNLSKLESLDLSSNNLSGGIPEALSKLTSLSSFNVSFNKLSGRIPSGGQFNTFTNSSYMCNLNLCGKPLDVCQSDLSPPIKGHNMQTENNHHFFLWLCLSIVLGFIMGFWTFWGTLFLKRNWRYAYFQFIDEQCEKYYLLAKIYVNKCTRMCLRS